MGRHIGFSCYKGTRHENAAPGTPFATAVRVGFTGPIGTMFDGVNRESLCQ